MKIIKYCLLFLFATSIQLANAQPPRCYGKIIIKPICHDDAQKYTATWDEKINGDFMEVKEVCGNIPMSLVVDCLEGIDQNDPDNEICIYEDGIERYCSSYAEFNFTPEMGKTYTVKIFNGRVEHEVTFKTIYCDCIEEEKVTFEICDFPGNGKWYQPSMIRDFHHYILKDPNSNDHYDYNYDSRESKYSPDPKDIIAHYLVPGEYGFIFYDKDEAFVKIIQVCITTKKPKITGPYIIAKPFCPSKGQNGVWLSVCDAFEKELGKPLPNNFKYIIEDPNPNDYNDYNFDSDKYAEDNNGGNCIHHKFIEGEYEVDFFDKDKCELTKLIIKIYPIEGCKRVIVPENNGLSLSSPIQKNEEFVLSPNPITSSFSINLKNKGFQKLEKITLLSTSGKVLQIFENISTNENIDISQYPSGVYFLSINSNETNTTLKVIKN